MPPSEPSQNTENDAASAEFDLTRSLKALAAHQRRFLNDLKETSNGDPRFLDAFRRWEEQLTLIKLALSRAEQRLLHYLLIPAERRPWRELPFKQDRAQDRFRLWNDRIQPYFKSLHIDPFYRRIGNPLDPDAEAQSADITTDLVALAEMCEGTLKAIECSLRVDQETYLEDLAFYHVLAPWKLRGMPALFDSLRWLHDFLCDHNEL